MCGCVVIVHFLGTSNCTCPLTSSSNGDFPMKTAVILQFIERNVYLVFMPFPARSSKNLSKVWEVPAEPAIGVINGSVIQNKHLLSTPEFTSVNLMR